MILKIFALLGVVAVGTFGTFAVNGQSDRPRLYQPSELKLERAIRRNFAGYRRQRRSELFMVDAFYPIGWSRDGKFAYYLEPVDQACGCYFAKLFVLDLKSDKTLWSFDYDSDSLEEAKRQGKPYSFDTVWRANRKLFADKLKEHKIEQQKSFAVHSFPAFHKGDRLTAILRTAEKTGLTDDERLYGIVERANLQLRSRRNGNKTILDHNYGKALPLYAGVVGYLKSPFEPRIAVVLVEISRGYEGPPHPGEIRLVGASLETGFK